MTISKKKQISLFMGIILTCTFLFSNAFAKENYSDKQSNMVNFNLDKYFVQIQNKGFSEYVNAIATFPNGSSVNINEDAIWKSDNTDIVYAENGRLLAMGKGTVKVSVSYEGFKQTIDVKVLNDINYEKLNHSIKKSSNESVMAASTWRDDITGKASRMLNYAWTPTRNLPKYNSSVNGYFTAGTMYYGVPYTTTDRNMQVDETGFYYAMSYSDFYTPWSNGTKTMPRYGNDCSGFSSFAWGIYPQTTYDFINGVANNTYRKVGSYNVNSPSTSDLISSYASLQEGDVVVTGEHMFVIDTNNSSGSYVWAFEQTPTLPVYSYHTYSQMASGLYRPISKY
ncbi:Ig-like domain-containing protein [Clostridium sp. BNL1100]|uniref:Ig-like domain-containing protein n=1 Tax=Clostridium sp. BNL1100 TaxID=755731 RepID=UPI00024A7B94|nr:Ig-like domain-containing protein [Clostridium sp. BNL1100]AEY66163.1 Ig-like domain-containing protein [Clostridium sp. BNL1100]